MCLPRTNERLSLASADPTRAPKETQHLKRWSWGDTTVDLTHVFRSGFPVAAFAPPERRPGFSIERDGCRSQIWSFAEHSGTHVDAPAHFAVDGLSCDEIPTRSLIFPVAVIDISERARQDIDALLSVDDVLNWERQHGRIPVAAGVFACSGWDAKVDDPALFTGIDSSGTFHSPGFSDEVVEFLLTARNITCIGIDTLSIDQGSSWSLPVHRRLLESGRYAVECLRDLKSVPAAGALCVVGVVPWEGGSGGPCRVLATW